MTCEWRFEEALRVLQLEKSGKKGSRKKVLQGTRKEKHRDGTERLCIKIHRVERRW